MSDADDFLMGGGNPSAKFPVIGTRVTGQIVRQPEVIQQTDFTTGKPKFWDDGKPRMQLAVELATDERDNEVDNDDGTRILYVKGQMKNVVRDAVRRAGAKGLEVGGRITVTYTHDGVSKSGGKPPKEYSAEYVAAAAAGANAFLSQGEPAPAPQQQYAPPVPQHVAPAIQQQYAAQAPVQQPVAAEPMPPGVDPQAWAAYQNLSPAQRAVLFPNGVPAMST